MRLARSLAVGVVGAVAIAAALTIARTNQLGLVPLLVAIPVGAAIWVLVDLRPSPPWGSDGRTPLSYVTLAIAALPLAAQSALIAVIASMLRGRTRAIGAPRSPTASRSP